MQNIHYDYAKSVMYQREEGLRNAQRTGTAFEPRQRRHWNVRWPFGARTQRPVLRGPVKAP